LKKNDDKKSFFSHPLAWCFTTYFAEGFPYSIIRIVSSFYFRTKNVSLESIGLTAFFGLPWILKFFWAPHIDRFLTKRWWIIMMQAIIASLFLLCAIMTPFPWGIKAAAIIFMMGAIFAATNDIAIDGYYLVTLDNERQSKYVGFRVLAYRCALMMGSGAIASIGASSRWGWEYAFGAAGGLLMLVTLYHLFFLPQSQTSQFSFRSLIKSVVTPGAIAGTLAVAVVVFALYTSVNSPFYTSLKATSPFFKQLGFPAWINIALFGILVGAALMRKQITAYIVKNSSAFYAQAFISFMEQERIGLLLAFIIFLRTGEILLSNMTSSFIVDIGIKEHFGWITAAVGLPASIAGALLGGYLISKFSLKTTILPFLLLQNGTNLIYMWLAFHLQSFVALNTGSAHPEFVGIMNLSLVASVHGFDQFSGGLGTSVLITFLMRICKGEYKAAHYAIGSGLMNLTGLFAGTLSGIIAAKLGYGWFFGVSFVASVPGMLLAIPLLPRLKDEGK
jgi:PAT family beta-lactamase induction signal transducer AmpG